ncbi:MAG: ATP-binding protein [Caldilineaceae bacterium]
MIQRPELTKQIEAALTRSRVVALLGPRQCGKTTLARTFVPYNTLNYFDLEDPRSLARLTEPMTALQDLQGLVVIDEIQRRPELFPLLRVLVDRTPLPARFLVLGSASPQLVRHTAESLAGRVETITMGGFTLREVGVATQSRHWLRGGFPLAFLAPDDEQSWIWRRNFAQTFLERDLPQLGITISASALLRFWMTLAHYHGQVWNNAEAARALGVSEPTARHYLDILTGGFMVRQLQPWYVNISKRQVKSPKIYLCDSGILHYLLGIRNELELLTHPKIGASWEGYALEETLRVAQPDAAYFWATHGGAELDLFMLKDGRKIGVEFKRADAPQLTASMRIALEDLQLDHLYVLYPGNLAYPLTAKATVLPLETLATEINPLFKGNAL